MRADEGLRIFQPGAFFAVVFEQRKVDDYA
jgi:hypothetical protein